MFEDVTKHFINVTSLTLDQGRNNLYCELAVFISFLVVFWLLSFFKKIFIQSFIIISVEVFEIAVIQLIYLF